MSQTGCLELAKTILHTYLLMKKRTRLFNSYNKISKAGNYRYKAKTADQPAFRLIDDAAGLTALPVPGM